MAQLMYATVTQGWWGLVPGDGKRVAPEIHSSSTVARPPRHRAVAGPSMAPTVVGAVRRRGALRQWGLDDGEQQVTGVRCPGGAAHGGAAGPGHDHGRAGRRTGC